MILHAYTIFCLSIYLSMYCFYLLVIVNNGAMNHYCVQISLQDPAQFFWVYTQSGNAISNGNSIFNFLRDNHMFFIAAEPFYNPTNSAQVFQFLHIFSNTCYFLGFVCLFNSSHPGQVWWFTPVIPALWEAEVGGSLEPGEVKVAVIVPLPSSLGDSVGPCFR